MKRLSVQYLPWLLWTFGVALAVVLIPVQHVLVPAVAGDTLALQIAIDVVVIALATIGAVIASRHPENPIGWLVLLFPFFAVIGEAIFTYARYAVHVEPGALPGGAIAGLLANSMWVIAYGSIPFITLLFPRGTLLSPRWRWVAWGLGASLGVITVATFLSPDVDVQVPPTVTNPLGIAGAEPVLDAVIALAGAAFGILWVTAGVSLVLRLARSSGDERQQIKWFAYTAAIFAVFMAVLLGSEVGGYAIPDPWVSILLAAFFLVLTLGLAMAILKYRLYDIDLVINRTLVYGPLTALLGGVYVGSVIGLQAAFRAATGQDSNVAIVISTLVIAALFLALRRRIQEFIDRRFYRRRYDAERTLASFAERMRQEVDIERLSGAVVRETMEPAHVSLWLREVPAGHHPGTTRLPQAPVATDS